MKTRIIVDSTADLLPKIRERVSVVPLTVHFGDEEYVDGVTIDHKAFYEKLVETDVHPTTSQATPAAFAEELQELEKLFLDITGKELPKYYRPPQGTYSVENLKNAKELGYKTVFWSLAYVDWNNDAQPTKEEAFAKLLPRIHNGAVILLHSTSKTNAEILDELLTKWKDMGYSFAPINELFS